MRRIVDCFTFFDEVRMLEFRLVELSAVVDTFVIVESNLTFSGNPKPLVFREHEERFARFLDRIVYVEHEGDPDPNLDPWDREEAQRNAIMRGLEQAGVAGTDCVLISDVDEIPRADLLRRIKARGFDIFDEAGADRYLFNLEPYELEPFDVAQYRFDEEIFGLLQTHHYYDLECRHAGVIWWQSRILTYRRLLELGVPDDVRRRDLGEQFYANAGWHFAYFGGVDRIVHKIESYSHQELNTPEFRDEQRIAASIRDRVDIFDRKIELEHIPLDQNDDLPDNYEMLL